MIIPQPIFRTFCLSPNQEDLLVRHPYFYTVRNTACLGRYFPFSANEDNPSFGHIYFITIEGVFTYNKIQPDI